MESPGEDKPEREILKRIPHPSELPLISVNTAPVNYAIRLSGPATILMAAD
jgi:hypothetical protein